MKARFFVYALVASATLAFFGAAPAFSAQKGEVHLRIVTPSGNILVTLDSKRAPKTVANFLHYVDAKFYNGGTFFRAIPGFVIQGGNKSRESERDQKIVLEDPKVTGLRNLDGSLAMARTSDPNSATSEFFIDDGKQPALDGPPGGSGYAVFGHVISGMNVVRKISHQPADSEMLRNPVQITRIERVK